MRVAQPRVELFPQTTAEHGLSERDFERIVFPVWKRVSIWLPRRLSYLRLLWCVLKLSSRNFASHIGILLYRSLSVDYGPMAEKTQNGHLFWNRRTCARVRGIKELEKLYPWASSIEQKIFLDGFDAGEKNSLTA